MTDARTTPSGTVARAIRLLSAVVDAGGPVSLQALGEASGLPASTTHRLLGLLADEGMVRYDAARHTYQAGAETYRLAARTVATVRFDEIVQPVLQGLADRFDETVLFGLYAPGAESLSFIARADGNHDLQYRIELNTPTSVLCGASGKAVGAYLEREVIARVVEREQVDTQGRPLPALDDLLRVLGEVRAAGHIETQGEKLPQARGIAVPVFGPAGVFGSLTLTHPEDRLPHGETDEIVKELQAGAAQISRFIGNTDQGAS